MDDMEEGAICPCCVEYHWCNDHGRTWMVAEHAAPGFTGAPIYWTVLACGCTLMDASQDTLEWVK